MSDNEITIKDLKELLEVMLIEGDLQRASTISHTIYLINRQKAEIERLKEEVSKARRKALLEASGKFAGHSDYHGDTILCKLICMAEGKEVGVAKPLDKGEIKSKAIKEFAEELKADCPAELLVIHFDAIDNLVKEIVGDEIDL